MAYNIIKDEERFFYKIEGTNEEIKTFAKALESVVSYGNLNSELEDLLENLEGSFNKEQFNLSAKERIYIGRNSLLYVSNVSYSARDFWFPILEEHFEEAMKIVSK